MHIAPSLILPDDLERARASGDLVIFAGAGVSMGPPANLPSFLELAREIASQQLPLRREDEDALDRYLGRAERARIKVQERAREKLLERGGSHTPLHEHLLGVFGKPHLVGLITTNFDTHFDSAAQAVFGAAEIPRYVGPALPPGRGFRGIAQLHGSLRNRQDRLVLTKQDFAAAYMTEGWAARFLVRIFEEQTVLFVGYGLGDPVVQYLLSALPATGRWFALCHVGEEARWIDHDVTPVTFDSSEDGNRFGDLQAGMQRWQSYARLSAVDHDNELRHLTALGPPSSPQDADYVRARLETEAGRATFWAAANDPTWLGWVAGEKLLDALFQPDIRSPELAIWARWCVSNFGSGDNPPLLQLCRQRSVHLNSAFAFELALHLSRENPLPPIPVLRQFVALLVTATFRPAPGSNPYVWLCEKLIAAGLGDCAIPLLRWMTDLRLEPLERLYLGFEESAAQQNGLRTLANRISVRAAPDDIDDLLEDHGATLAALACEALVELGERRLAEAYELLHLARGEDDSTDWLSFGRTAIAPTNQDAYAHAEDVLIAVVRTGLDYWRDHTPDRLLTFGDRYCNDDRRLLKRLALYAFAECASASADDLLSKALQLRWPADFWVRPEFYRLLGAHYYNATEPVKERFVTSLADNAWWGEFDEHQAHARFSLSQFLLRLSPGSEATRRFADGEKAAHPDWLEGDPEGLLSRIEVGSRGEGPSPIEVDKMLGWEPAEALRRIVSELEDNREEGT